MTETLGARSATLWPRRDLLKLALCAASVPPWLGCQAPVEPVPVDPHLTARPGVPTIDPIRGATPLGLASGRDGTLYVPASYDPATPAPLFVAFHGAGGSSAEWAAYRTRAEQRKMILLAPDSRSPTWDLLLRQVGPDVTFLDRALRHTFARCRIDPARICLGGFSDGASYALTLGVSNGDLFTNLIGYSPGLLTFLDGRIGKPRVFISHGASDPILPVTTTRDVIVPALRGTGYDTTYREFSGVHEVPAAISEAALDWFLP